MHDVFRDLALAVRGAVRRPGYSLAVIATLAIGIGANTAIFSLFNWILYRPLPGVHAPGDLVTIRFHSRNRESYHFVTYRDYAALRDSVRQSLSGLAAATQLNMEMATGETSTPVDAEVVTSNYLSVLGAQPRLGRDFLPAEDHAGGPASAIISTALWQRAFESNPEVIGTTLTLNGRSFTIVGVANARFQGSSVVSAADVWLPLSSFSMLQPPASAARIHQHTLFGDAVGRLKPGVSIVQAQAEATAGMTAMPDFANRLQRIGAVTPIGPVIYPGVGHDTFLLERLTTVSRLLMGAVGLLLLLACANAANLLLARSTARRREIAVCQAIGATRMRIIRQQMIEALALSAVAGVIGIALAAWLTWLFDGMQILMSLPAVSGVSVDWRVVLFAMTASLLTAVIFATAPAVLSSRVELLPSLKDGVTTTRGGRRMLRGVFVAMQITVSVLLLFSAGLFVRTLQNIRGLDLGIQPNGIVSFGIQPGRFGVDDKRSSEYVQQLLERVRHAPGITSAAFTWTTSFSANRSDATYVRVDAPGREVAAANTRVSSRFFETMGIRFVAGRDFTEADTRTQNDASGPVIISRSLANALFPDGAAIGSRLKPSSPEGTALEVVGVVADVRGRSVTDDPEPWVYRPAVEPTWGTIQVRSQLPAAQVVATIREVARSVDPVIAPHDIETFATAVDRALSEQRLFARASSVFALVAAVLAGIGIYGMMAGAVAERRKEFGIRLALGATAGSVLTLVLRSSTLIACAGLAAGLGGSIAVGRVVESRLFAVSRFDPFVMMATALSIFVLAIVASLAPALRAARVDPVQSLRAE